MFCLFQVLDSKYQGIFLQLAQGIQGFVFHQLAKGERGMSLGLPRFFLVVFVMLAEPGVVHWCRVRDTQRWHFWFTRLYRCWLKLQTISDFYPSQHLFWEMEFGPSSWHCRLSGKQEPCWSRVKTVMHKLNPSHSLVAKREEMIRHVARLSMSKRCLGSVINDPHCETRSRIGCLPAPFHQGKVKWLFH